VRALTRSRPPRRSNGAKGLQLAVRAQVLLVEAGVRDSEAR
jgi:hypothetical protein